MLENIALMLQFLKFNFKNAQILASADTVSLGAQPKQQGPESSLRWQLEVGTSAQVWCELDPPVLGEAGPALLR